MVCKERKEGIKKGVKKVERRDVLVFREGGTLALTTGQLEWKTIHTCTRLYPEGLGRLGRYSQHVIRKCGSFFVFIFAQLLF